MPSRDVVRSLILPKNGLPTMDNKAPIPVTSAKLFGACAIPTSELTFNASVTSRGARNSRQVPMYANVYSEMKPHPTRWISGASDPCTGCAAGRCCHPSSLSLGGCSGCPVGVLFVGREVISVGRERSGIARSPHNGREPATAPTH